MIPMRQKMVFPNTLSRPDICLSSYKGFSCGSVWTAEIKVTDSQHSEDITELAIIVLGLLSPLNHQCPTVGLTEQLLSWLS